MFLQHQHSMQSRHTVCLADVFRLQLLGLPNFKLGMLRFPSFQRCQRFDQLSYIQCVCSFTFKCV